MTTLRSVAQEIAESKYAMLTTFRKDGSAVGTPVWIMQLDDGLGVWTGLNSGKVKRLRGNASVEVATCDMRGRHVGPALAGHAEILGKSDADRVRMALRRKYGLIGRLYVRIAERGDRATKLACLKITLDGAGTS